MVWKLKIKIENFKNYSFDNWEDMMNAGLMVYFPEKGKVLIRSIQNYKILKEVIFEKEINGYSFWDKDLYVRFDNVLKKVIFSDEISLVKQCETQEDLIFLLNEHYSLGKSTKPGPGSFKNVILSNQDGEIIYHWKDSKHLMFWDNNHFYFEDFPSGLLRKVDISTKEEQWSHPFNRFFPGKRMYQKISNDLIITNDVESKEGNRVKKLVGIGIENGTPRWEISEVFNSYVYHKEYKLLFGIDGHTLHIIDPEKGAIIDAFTLDTLDKSSSWVSSPSLSIKGDKLIFSTSNSEVGCYDISRKEIEFLLKVEVDKMLVDTRKPLDKPVIYENKLFVRDNSGTLHIYENVAV